MRSAPLPPPLLLVLLLLLGGLGNKGITSRADTAGTSQNISTPVPNTVSSQTPSSISTTPIKMTTLQPKDGSPLESQTTPKSNAEEGTASGTEAQSTVPSPSLSAGNANLESVKTIFLASTTHPSVPGPQTSNLPSQVTKFSTSPSATVNDKENTTIQHASNQQTILNSITSSKIPGSPTSLTSLITSTPVPAGFPSVISPDISLNPRIQPTHAPMSSENTTSVISGGTASVASGSTASVVSVGTASVASGGTASVAAGVTASVAAGVTASVAAGGTTSVAAGGTTSVNPGVVPKESTSVVLENPASSPTSPYSSPHQPPAMTTSGSEIPNKVTCQVDSRTTENLLILKMTNFSICDGGRESRNHPLYTALCRAGKANFNKDRDLCHVQLVSQPEKQEIAVLNVAVQTHLQPKELYEVLKKRWDDMKLLGVSNMTYGNESLDKELEDRFSMPLIITIVCMAAFLLLVAALYGCFHQRFTQRKDQQRLTEELQTVENGYHDNPTLEVMETSSEMQEKKVANLNGELGDSWIVPLDNLTKDDLDQEEEDTHL